MNPALKRLGFVKQDRVAILHADDIGMCQATLPAYADLLDFGLISSAAAMVPCPWFPELAAFCRQHPNLDMGVHLTLTNEYSGYRWGPLSTRSASSGLLDTEGYLHSGPPGVWQCASPRAVERELQAQVSHALASGIDVTHIDTHQLSAIHARFLQAYVRLAARHRLPLMLLRLDQAGWEAVGQRLGLGFDPDTASLATRLVVELDGRGVPLIDHATMLPLDAPGDRVEQAKRALDALPPGLTHFVLHPAVDTPELRAITTDWPARVADYRAFTSQEVRDHVRRTGVQIIGYRALRALV